MTKPKLTVITNPEMKEGDATTVLSQYEVDALLRAVSGDLCHLQLVHSKGPDTHITKRVKRRIFMNLVSIFSLPVRSFEQYEYLINRPARSAVEFSEFVIQKLRR